MSDSHSIRSDFYELVCVPQSEADTVSVRSEGMELFKRVFSLLKSGRIEGEERGSGALAIS